MDSRHPCGETDAQRPRTWILALATTAALTLALGALGPAPAWAQTTSETVPIDDACPASAREADPFDDVEPGGLHAEAIGCLWVYGIAAGVGVRNDFGVTNTVTREQMASYLVAAIETATGQELPRTESFNDVADTHRASVEKLASIGATAGTGGGDYSPRLPVTRRQMASFVARTLNHLVSEGLLEPIAYQPATSGRLGITDVEVAAHDGFDRVTLTIEGDDGDVGFRARYVDDPRSAGSGFEVQVDGEAVLQLSLVGMAIPDDLSADVQDRLWEEERLAVNGAGIIEVVNDHVFEGQQELFLGTTGVNGFEVGHLDDPQRVVVDVQHD